MKSAGLAIRQLVNPSSLLGALTSVILCQRRSLVSGVCTSQNAPLLAWHFVVEIDALSSQGSPHSRAVEEEEGVGSPWTPD